MKQSTFSKLSISKIINYINIKEFYFNLNSSNYAQMSSGWEGTHSICGITTHVTQDSGTPRSSSLNQVKRDNRWFTKEEDWQGQEECVIISTDKHNLKTHYCTPTGLATFRELNNREVTDVVGTRMSC